jgi:hypothetical protein
MTKTRWALGALVVIVLGLLLLRGCNPAPVPQADVQKAASTAASAIVAKATVDTAISQHRVDSVVRMKKIPARLQTKRHADSMETALRQEVALRFIDNPPDPVADSTATKPVLGIVEDGLALVDTLHKQIKELEADTAALGNDNRRLASAAEVASRRLTQDTTVILPSAPPHKHLLGISLPSLAQLKKLIPAITIQKDLVRFDKGVPSVAPLTSVSVGVGYTIRL